MKLIRGRDMAKRGRPVAKPFVTMVCAELIPLYQERERLRPLQDFMSHWVSRCQLLAIDAILVEEMFGEVSVPFEAEYKWPQLTYNQELEHAD